MVDFGGVWCSLEELREVLAEFGRFWESLVQFGEVSRSFGGASRSFGGSLGEFGRVWRSLEGF